MPLNPGGPPWEPYPRGLGSLAGCVINRIISSQLNAPGTASNNTATPPSSSHDSLHFPSRDRALGTADQAVFLSGLSFLGG